MIAIIDYGSGNLHSVQKAVALYAKEAIVTDQPGEILSADKIILPGVGAFSECIKGLQSGNLVDVIKKAVTTEIPLLGICVGMQMLFDMSEEKGLHAGLGFVPGQVRLFTQSTIRVPQIGWNQVDLTKPSPLMDDIPERSYFYFNHSYYCVPEDDADTLTTTVYGLKYTSSIVRGNIFGVQFHPEKSQVVGLQFIKNFVEM